MDDQPLADGLDWVDEKFDRRLRADLARGLATGQDPHDVLHSLAPAFSRARRIRRLQTVAIGLVASVALVGGIGLAGRFGVLSERAATVAGEPEEPNDGHAGGVGTEDDLTVGTLEVTGTSAGDGQSESVPPEDPAEESVSSAAATESTSTTTTSPSTTASTTGLTPPGSATAPGPTTIDSDCGSIVVSVSGSSVRLEDVRPDPGRSADVKSSGPRSIEVSLEGDGDHCELKAWAMDGELMTEVERED